MKKLFIISTAAILALVACSKTETANPDPKLIGFNVANYKAQTKAYNSLLDEKAAGADIVSFTTNAWYHDGASSYGSQTFMADQVIKPENTTDPTYWAPEGRNYYWPKTGYVNFFSYAGSPAPTAKAEGSITYTDVAVPTNANILVADAAYRFSSNTTNDNTIYQQNSVTKGVPTLFHHILAKVKFDVVLDAKTGMANPDNKDKWTVSITSAYINVPQQGTIALTFTDPTTDETTASFSGSWGSLGDFNHIDNVTGTGANVADPENYEIDDAITLTAVGGTISVEENRSGYNTTGTPAELIPESAVIPHTLTNDITFAMTYKLAYRYNDGTPVQEFITIPETKLTDFAPSITAWAMNTIYTYHVIIKPNEQVLFDPAVETWAEVESADSELNF